MGRDLIPYVIVYVTMSADGKIASVTGESRISCPHDLKRLHKLRAGCDAVIIGANTLLKDDPLLTVRFVKGRNPIAVVFDGRLRARPTLRLFRERGHEAIIMTCNNVSQEAVERFEEMGVKVVKLSCVNWRFRVREALKKLGGMGIHRVLVEGGGNLVWSFFEEGLVNEFRATISPFIIGGERAVTPVGGRGFRGLNDWVRLRLTHVIRCECGEEVHLIYVVKDLTRDIP